MTFLYLWPSNAESLGDRPATHRAPTSKAACFKGLVVNICEINGLSRVSTTITRVITYLLSGKWLKDA